MSCRDDNFYGPDSAAKSTQQQSLQPVLRLRPTCAGITFEGRVAFAMREIWKPVFGWEGLYEVSSTGRVRALYAGNHGAFKPGRIVKPGRHSNGYVFVTLYRPTIPPEPGRGTLHPGTHRSVHSLVLEAFKCPRPPGKVTRHKDGNRTNNTPGNLRWGTPKQNYDDSRKHQTNCEGERNGFAILTNEQVVQMRKVRAETGMTYHALGEMFNTHWSNAYLIVKGKTWKNAR